MREHHHNLFAGAQSRRVMALIEAGLRLDAVRIEPQGLAAVLYPRGPDGRPLRGQGCLVHRNGSCEPC